ncbi:MAG: cell division protein FtsA [Holosporales bacterium]|jgi:cell division protein FtsA|nr:cell division protein FtsA [Holosporales bacterium]
MRKRLLRKIINIKKEVAALDLGTSAICAAIIKKEKKESEEFLGVSSKIRVLGVGYQLAKGIKKGAITDLEDLEESILNTISTVEKEAQKSIKSIFVALPSWALSSHAAEASINIGQLPIDDIHINSLINFDASRYIDGSNEVIHVFPVSYSVDDARDIIDPIGMVGKTLSAKFHIITAQSSLIKNLTNCLNRNNIEVIGFISSTYASALSVLLEDEIKSGATLIDIGGAITSIACFYEDTPLYLGFIPIGSQNITNDIATVLRTTKPNAERLKTLHGVSGGILMEEESILVSRVDEYGEEHIQNISKGMLDQIISTRLYEILSLAQDHIRKCGADRLLYQRIVVTGGGSLLSGLSEFIKFKKLFGDVSVRLGKPLGVVGSHDFVRTASFASVAGAATYYLGDFPNRVLTGGEESLWQKIITWFKRGV